MADWLKRYAGLIREVASWSKDTTQVGALIFSPETHAILSMGYNGFPRGVNDDVPARKERPLKYKYTVHAETNAIYNAARHGTKTNRMGMALAWYPCANCAGAIVQAGLTTLICHKPDFNDERWGEDFKITHAILGEAGINVVYMDEDEKKASNVVSIAA